MVVVVVLPKKGGAWVVTLIAADPDVHWYLDISWLAFLLIQFDIYSNL